MTSVSLTEDYDIILMSDMSCHSSCQFEVSLTVQSENSDNENVKYHDY